MLVSKLITHLRFDPVNVFQKLGLTHDSSMGASRLIRRRIDRIFENCGLSELFRNYGDLRSSEEYKLFLSGHKKADIVNIYMAAQSAQTVVELGCGVSTLAIAYALKSKKGGT